MDDNSNIDLIKKISRMNFNDAIDFFLENLTYYSLIKSRQNYSLGNLFLMYIRDNFESFKALVNSSEKVRYDLTNLFHLNTFIKSDNLISLIIEDEANEELVNFLDEQIAFDSMYLNDDIMSSITPNNISIYKNLKGNNRKYLYSMTNSVCISDEEQKDTYDQVLSEYPEKFRDELFSYSIIIRDNTPNENEIYTLITKMMFDFMETSINNPKLFYNYLYNISKIYQGHVSNKNYYNTFLLSRKYPNIHQRLFEKKLDNESLYKKLQILSYLPPLVDIDNLDVLEKISLEDIYKRDINSSLNMNELDASPNANVYEYSIFESERQIISISNEEMKVSYADVSHYHTLLMMYPNYCHEETINEVVQKVNQISHDMLLITEGDTLFIWLPSLENITSNQINMLKNKLNEIKDPSEISVLVALENNGSYSQVPFSTVDELIDYLKNSKKVRR